MIDCSHANAGGDYRRQPQVWRDVLRDHIASSNAVIGMMVESNLYEGKQPIAADLTQLRYGVSVTDACVGWETTERMLIEAYEAVGR
jgi:3-deoxy-7-phosphoheptulonate synthase